MQCVAGVKRTGREANHSPPSSADVKNACSYASTPPYVLHGVYLVKPRKKFIFICNVHGDNDVRQTEIHAHQLMTCGH